MRLRILSVILSVLVFSQVGFPQECISLKNVAAGEYHTLALGKNDGSLWSCGGSGDCYKQLGLGDGIYNVSSLQPVLGPNGVGLLKNIIAFDAGLEHSLAVNSNGFCLSWGYDDVGELGNGPGQQDSSVPIKVHGLNNDSNGLRNIVKVSAGRSGLHSLAVTSDGNVVAWGYNYYGQCGDGYPIHGNNWQYPILVVDSNTQTTGRFLGNEANIVDVDAGVFHSLALAKREDGGFVYEWGDGLSYPHKVHGPNNVGCLRNIIDIATCNCSLAADSNGQVWKWTTGQPPTRVPGGGMGTTYLKHIVKVAAGDVYRAAIDSNGNVWEWTDYDVPVKVSNGQMETRSGYLEDIIALDAGFFDFKVAVDRYGHGWGWGVNSYGQLGVGDTEQHTEPVPMLSADFVPSPIILTNTDDAGECLEPNDIITCQICFNANGFSDTNVVLTDYLPYEVNYYSSPYGIYDSNTHSVVWQVGQISGNSNNCYTSQIKVKSTAPLGRHMKNVAQLIGDNYETEAVRNTKICCPYPVVYVKWNAGDANNGSNWTNAYTNLQTALTNVRNGNCGCADQIWVARGTYKPTNDAEQTDANFAMLDGIDVYGHFEGWESSIDQRNLANANNATILSGGITDDNHSDVRKVVTAADCHFDGFTVRRSISKGILCSACLPTIENCIVKNNNSCGIYCTDGSHTTVTNTFINNNTGSGIYCYGLGTEVSIDRCTIGPSNADGLYLRQYTEVEIVDSIVSDNGVRGIYSQGDKLTIENCNVADNQTGIRIDNSYAHAIVKNSVISGNDSYGLYCYSSQSHIENNLIFDNGGYGIYLDYTPLSVEIRNNTIVANHSNYGIFSSSYSNDPNISSNIIWGNASGGLTGTFNKVNYNCIQGTSIYPGTRNINNDPCFRNLTNHDYHLKYNSPCIDKGDPNFSSSTETDIDGEARVMDGNSDGVNRVDIGADEFYPFDLYSDGIVNFRDFAVFAKSWKKSYGQSDYNDRCDFYNDGKIDYKDLDIFCTHWLYTSGLDNIGGQGAYFPENFSENPLGQEGEGNEPPPPPPPPPVDANTIIRIVDIDDNNEITIGIGESITLYLRLTTTEQGSLDILDVDAMISDTNLGSIDNREYDPNDPNDPNNGTARILAEPRDSSFDYVGPGYEQPEGITLMAANLWADFNDGNLASFVFTCNGEGDVTLSLKNYLTEIYPKLESILIHQVDSNSQQMMMGGSGAAMESSQVSEDVDIDELVDWLDQLWQSDEEVRNSISEEDWLEFLETIESSQ